MSENPLSRRSVLRKSAAATVTAGSVGVIGSTTSAGYSNTLYFELDGSEGEFYVILDADSLGQNAWTEGSGWIDDSSSGVVEVGGSLDDGSGWFNSPDQEAKLEFSNDDAAQLAEDTWDHWDCSDNVPGTGCHDDENVDTWLNGSCVARVESDRSCNP